MMKLLFSLSRLSSNGKTITLTFASESVALRGSGVYDQLRLLAQPVNAAANKSPPANRLMVSLRRVTVIPAIFPTFSPSAFRHLLQRRIMAPHLQAGEVGSADADASREALLRGPLLFPESLQSSWMQATLSFWNSLTPRPGASQKYLPHPVRRP